MIADKVTFYSYSRIKDSRPGAASRYLIQLRSRQHVSMLAKKPQSFDPGVLVSG